MSTSPPRGRIVVGTLGLDGHEVGAMAVARLLVRHGFEVIYLGKHNPPERFVVTAESEDAQVIGISIHSWEFTAHIDALVADARERGIAVVVGGSVLTASDQADLEARGVRGVFGPWASAEDIVARLDQIVEERREEPTPTQRRDQG